MTAPPQAPPTLGLRFTCVCGVLTGRIVWHCVRCEGHVPVQVAECPDCGAAWPLAVAGMRTR